MTTPRLGFDRAKDPLAYEAYEQLRKLGEKDFDVGFPVVAFGKAGKAPEIRGKGDGVIEGEEVRRRALQLLARNPDDQALQGVVKAFSVKVIVWALDGETRARVAKAIELLQGDLGGKDVSRMSDGELKRFAYGLFSFAMMTGNPSAPPVPGILQERFRDCGLERLADHVAQHGGLGLADIRGDSPIELPASYVFKNMLGACTERSKVLYGIFEQAGLKPFFAQSTMSGLMLGLERAKLIEPGAPVYGNDASHTFIGLPFKDGFTYYDPLYGVYGLTYGDVAHLELINYLSVDLTNTSESYFQSRQPEMAANLLQRAFQADPRMPTTLVSASYQAVVMGDWAAAEFHARAAVKTAPDFSRAHHALSIALKRQKKYPEALKHAARAVKAEPSHEVIRRNHEELTQLVKKGR